MYKTILVPIDMSHVAEGKANIDLAAQHAAAGASIILLNVVEEIPNWAAVELPAGLLEKSLDSSQSKLEEIASTDGAGVIKSFSESSNDPSFKAGAQRALENIKAKKNILNEDKRD